jgi:predicted  nucleic acid-binding Zn-ribbon protein
MSDPSKGPEFGELRCPKCGHKWRTRSRLVFVTCPSCYTKVRNRKRGDS